MNEPLFNRHFYDLDDLGDDKSQRCVFLQDSPDLIRSHASFRLLASPQRKTLAIIKKSMRCIGACARCYAGGGIGAAEFPSVGIIS
jgi:hypothetical protein